MKLENDKVTNKTILQELVPVDLYEDQSITTSTL